MRIAICADVYTPMTNGAAVFVENLAKSLACRGHQVLVVCPSFKKHKYLERCDKNLQVAHLSSARFPFYPDQLTPVEESKKFFGHKTPKIFYKNGLFWATNALSEVTAYLDEFKPDVIHLQTPAPVGLAAQHYADKHDIAQVVTSHNYPDTTGTGNLLKPIKKPVDAVVKAYLANFVKNSEAATAPSEVAVKDLIPDRRAFRKIPVRTISNGVDLSNFAPGAAPATIYEKYHIPRNVPIVLHVGRIDPEKSIDVVIGAFAQLSPKLPKARLLIVGDGTDRENLELLVKEKGISSRTIFAGRVLPPDLYDIYKVGTVFVTASAIETQGIVLIEAAATGLPLVAVNKCAAPEACQDGRNGIICEPDSAPEISAALHKILTNSRLRRRLSEGSLAVAKENDLKETVKAFEDVYREAIKINAARLTRRGK